MIAPAIALSLLSTEPSASVIFAAKAAAASRHGLVNLTRLARALDRQTAADVDLTSTWYEVQRTWETVLYARALLEALRNEDQQTSTTASTLDSISSIIHRIEERIKVTANNTAAPPPVALPYITLPSLRVPAAEQSPIVALLDDIVPDTHLDEAISIAPVSLSFSPLPTIPPLSLDPISVSARFPDSLTSNAIDIKAYFDKRAREDAQSGETGLLPLKSTNSNAGGVPSTSTEKETEGMRQRLLGGSKSAIGSSQLHEELGGQLADMSHRLKLNALHFSSSLEEEKALLQSSQDVLEKNLTTTMLSKKQLSTVAKKGRGTTCMTLGVVIIVLVLFIWTYMLIRFT